MDRELIILTVVVTLLTMRAIYASAVLHRHIGWIVATSFAAVLAVDLLSAPDWTLLTCIVVFAVSEAAFQLGEGPDPRPPARWLNPLIRRLPDSPPGRHQRRKTSEPT